MPVRIVSIVIAGIVVILLVVFALFNQGLDITLSLGIARWRGEAVFAIYAGIFIGLALMFLLGLPVDLAARRERLRLSQRLKVMERELRTRDEESSPAEGAHPAGE